MSCVSFAIVSYCYGDHAVVVHGVRVPAEGPTTLQWRRRWDLLRISVVGSRLYGFIMAGRCRREAGSLQPRPGVGHGGLERVE